MDTTGGSPEALFAGLTADTAYTVSITATGNANYANSQAGTLSVTTLAAVTPTKVTNLQVTALDESLMVSWTAASVAPGGYSVRWREKGPGKALSPVNDVAGTSFTIDDLTNGQEYVVRVDTRNAADSGVQAGTAVTGTGTPAVVRHGARLRAGREHPRPELDGGHGDHRLHAAGGDRRQRRHQPRADPGAAGGREPELINTRGQRHADGGRCHGHLYLAALRDSDSNTANGDTAALTFRGDGRRHAHESDRSASDSA